MVIMFIILGLLLGIGLISYILLNPIEIKPSYSVLDWVIPIAGIILAFLVLFIIEIGIANSVEGLKDNKNCYIVYLFLYNGILIPFFALIISRIFMFSVKRLKLDRSDLFSPQVGKVCILMTLPLIIIRMLIIVFDSANEFIINRLIMWVITIMGIWVGFNFEENIHRNKERFNLLKIIRDKKTLHFWLPIILIVFVLIILVYTIDTTFVNNAFIISIPSFMISSILMCMLYKKMYNPSEKDSIKKLNKVYNEYEQNNHISSKTNFGWMVYYLKDKRIYLEKIYIKYDGHEEEKEFKDLFDSYDFEFESYEELKRYLSDRRKKQLDYIEKERELLNNNY